MIDEARVAAPIIARFGNNTQSLITALPLRKTRTQLSFTYEPFDVLIC